MIGTIVSSNNNLIPVAFLVPRKSFKKFKGVARDLVLKDPLANFNQLYEELSVVFNKVDLTNKAAIISDSLAISQTIFKGKAKTLENLSPISKESKIVPGIRFNNTYWLKNKQKLLNKIQTQFKSNKFIVRSSTVSEDNLDSSLAGAFTTIADIGPNDSQITKAVETVFKSFSKFDRKLHQRDEVLIQPQVTNLQSSGVMFTRDPRSGAPYLIINLDEVSGRSDIVTSGTQGELKTYLALPKSNIKHLPENVQKILRVGEELVKYSHLPNLDIEFGISKDQICHLFQTL